jgi:hypothetical protein
MAHCYHHEESMKPRNSGNWNTSMAATTRWRHQCHNHKQLQQTRNNGESWVQESRMKRETHLRLHWPSKIVTTLPKPNTQMCVQIWLKASATHAKSLFWRKKWPIYGMFFFEIARFRQKVLSSSMSPKYIRITKCFYFPIWPVAKFVLLWMMARPSPLTKSETTLSVNSHWWNHAKHYRKKAPNERERKRNKGPGPKSRQESSPNEVGHTEEMNH